MRSLSALPIGGHPLNLSLSLTTITENMDWGQHISDISTKTLGFLRWKLAFAPKSICTKEVAYKTLVLPKFEYEAPIF